MTISLEQEYEDAKNKLSIAEAHYKEAEQKYDRAKFRAELLRRKLFDARKEATHETPHNTKTKPENKA